jgi:uncharacterized protein (DUF433 family)
MQEYVEERNGGLYVAGTRISLDSVVYAFNRGSAPESIQRSFPALNSAEKLYGAITYYLANKASVDNYLARKEMQYEEQRANQELPLGMKDRIEAARSGAHTSHR